MISIKDELFEALITYIILLSLVIDIDFTKSNKGVNAVKPVIPSTNKSSDLFKLS